MNDAEGEGPKALLLIGSRGALDLLAIWLVVSFAVELSLLGDRSLILAVLAFISTYFASGYAAQAALFPERGVSLLAYKKEVTSYGDRANIMERLALSVVLSLVFVAIGGIGLLWSPWGLTELGSLILVLVLTYGWSLFALYRRSKLPAKSHFGLAINIKKSKEPLNAMEKLISVVSVIALILAGGMILAGIGQNGGIEPYTEFALLDSDGKLVNLPHNVLPGENWTVRVAVTNHMQEDMLYNLTVGLSPNGSFASYQGLDMSQATPLNPGEGWTVQLILSDREAYSHPLRFSVAAEGSQKVYYHLTGPGTDLALWLWLNVGLF